MEVKKTELLAPAQNLDCAKAAILFGADAVYMGANAYGARAKAGNPLEDIEAAALFAHSYGAKLYVTLNTILDDDEILKAKELIHTLYDIGADAIIVQDMGILELAVRGEIPPIRLFASTQCDNRTLEKVKFFEAVGVSRVILARELSLGAISHICKNTSLEVETFIHGALCVCYSGQCYLSHALGGRSANRGECAQVCRKKYTLTDEKGKILSKDRHLLSLKDFMAAKHLQELVNVGVSSFKIEGRLKGENYVKNVVGYYRKQLDELISREDDIVKTSSGKVDFDFVPDPKKSFNRGFCGYFLTDDEKIFNHNTPKSLGESLGKVKSITKDYFTIDTKIPINPQDGLFNGTVGCLVNKVCGGKIYPNKMPSFKVNDVIFRNYDAEFEKTLKNSKTARKIGVVFKVYGSYLEALDEDKNLVRVDFEASVTTKNPKRAAQIFTEQLKKCGQSHFRADDVEIHTNHLPHLAIGEINAIRRKALEALVQKRLDGYSPTPSRRMQYAKYPCVTGDYRLNVYNSLAKSFYEKCGSKVTQMALEKGTQPKGKELARMKYCLKKAFDICKCGGKLYLTDDKNIRLEADFDCKNCEMTLKLV